MDLGSSTFTKFKNDETIASYIADNIELFNCDMGLIHSHNRMSCFFSGTDTATLQSEGNDTNCFVSLIVNNEGTYCAAITRKLQLTKKVTVQTFGISYEFFGEGNKTITEGKSPVEETSEETTIQYFMLDVERDLVDNPFDFLDKRFDEIENLKKSEAKSQVFLSNINNNSRIEDKDEDFYSWIHSNRNKSAEIKESLYASPQDYYKEPTLFDEKTMKDLEVTEEWVPDEKKIHHLVCQLIACSLIVNKDIDLKQWIVRHMVKKYDELFKCHNSIQFDNWKEYIIEFMIGQYDDSDAPIEMLDSDFDLYQAKIANAMYDELSEYPTNPYIEQYKESLTLFMYG